MSLTFCIPLSLMSVLCAAQAETFWQSSPFMLQRYGLGWWALQLPAVRFIVGSFSFRQFEQWVSMKAWHPQLK